MNFIRKCDIIKINLNEKEYMQLVGKVGGIEEELRGEGIWVDLTKTYMYV